MRTVNFAQAIVYGMAHLLGIDPSADLLKDHARAWVASINSKVRMGWTAWAWPGLEITEERAFRQVWYSGRTYEGGQGEESELYYAPNQTYYRAYGNPGGIPPNINDDTDNDYFAKIEDAELDRHIAFEQTGKQTIELVTAVNQTNPRISQSSILLDFAPGGPGIDVPFNSGPTVWVTFQPPPPVFTSATWSGPKNYMRGDCVLDIATGECFLALQSSQGKPVTDSGYWLRQDFPYFLAEYVKYDAAADQTEDLQTKADLRGQAQEALGAEIRKLLRQGQRTKYRRFGLGTRRRQGWVNLLPPAQIVSGAQA